MNDQVSTEVVQTQPEPVQAGQKPEGTVTKPGVNPETKAEVSTN